MDTLPETQIFAPNFFGWQRKTIFSFPSVRFREKFSGGAIAGMFWGGYITYIIPINPHNWLENGGPGWSYSSHRYVFSLKPRPGNPNIIPIHIPGTKSLSI